MQPVLHVNDYSVKRISKGKCFEFEMTGSSRCPSANLKRFNQMPNELILEIATQAYCNTVSNLNQES